MPKVLKRRSEVLTTNNGSSSESPEPPAQRRRRSSSIASSASSIDSLSPDRETQIEVQDRSNTEVLVKKLVRLALSTEYARLPLRRTEISQKILKDNNVSHKLFRPVFAGAQKVLQQTFGMTLIELPGREKTTLKDRRMQATQTQKSQSTVTSNKAWILVSTLPSAYKQRLEICPPTRAPSQEVESEYTALYTFVLALIYLNNSVLTDAKLERYLKRVNADTYTPAGATDKLLQRMVKDGYLEKRRDTSSGEEIIEWVVGPRGKIEVGARGVGNLVKGVYGFGPEQPVGEGADQDDRETENGTKPKIEEEELDKRLERSLGIKINPEDSQAQQQSQQTEVDGVQDNDERSTRPERRRRGRPRRNDNDSDDD